MAQTRTRWMSSMVLALILLLLPALASAQQASGIGGVVRDASGAVLPGVTVEASSTALIEKVRTVVTDGAGQYSIVDLRPGTYVVTFTLPGFSTVQREGIELPGGFTATVNAELRVGALEETITVTAEAPLVDVQSVQQQKGFSDEVLSTLPSGARAWGTLAVLVPGLTFDAGITSFTGTGGVWQENNLSRTSGGVLTSFHGKTGTDNLYNGMSTVPVATGGSMGYIVNSYASEEVRVQTGAVSAETKMSGLSFDIIPKEGGNSFKGGLFGQYTTSNLQSDNLTDALKARGLTSGGHVDYSYDVTPTLGGALLQDKLWFFASGRYTTSSNQVAGLFYNKTQGTPVYTPDPSRPAFTEDWFRSEALRLTWQATPRNKINLFVDDQHNCTCRLFQANQSAETLTVYDSKPQRLFQGTWNSPVTNRMLLEGGVSIAIAQYSNRIPGPGVKLDDHPITDQGTGLTYNARTWIEVIQPRYSQKLSASYITGSHAFKAGVQIDQGHHEQNNPTNGNNSLTFTFLNGVPTQLSQRVTADVRNDLRVDFGTYIQDRWTVRRLTLSMGVRMEYFNAYVKAQTQAADAWLPQRSFAEVPDVPAWKMIHPRLGASYDLFGDGRTALKVSLGRYNGPVGQQAVAIAGDNNPVNTTVNSVTRSWADTNGNYVPDCNLMSPVTNGECGPISNVAFGQLNVVTRYADDVLKGWDARDYYWDISTEVQHQIGPGLSVTGGYYRNWYRNFYVTDNLAVAPSDYSPYCITAPSDRRLPGGGGYQVCGLYDVAPAKFGQVNNLITRSSHYGDQSKVSDFFGVNLNWRLSRLQVGGGVDTGRSVTNTCFTIDSPAASSISVNGQTICDTTIPFRAQTQIKMQATFELPLDFHVGVNLQNASGPTILANYTATNNQIAPSLGHNLAACGTRSPCTSTVSGIPLIVPYTQFEDRRNQIDLRLGKIVRLSGRANLQANLDIFNLFNDAAITIRNNTYGSSWGVPQRTVDARLVILGGQLTF